MKEYHKIQSIFKRDKKGQFIDEFSCPEFDYLYNNEWVGTEKIDGTNIRIHWNGEKVIIGGRTDRAQIPTFLYNKLEQIIETIDFPAVFPDCNDVTLYGEGYGAKIQKVGAQYIPDGVDFILFDVRVGDWWLKREDVGNVAEKFGIGCVPVVYIGTLHAAIDGVKKGFPSTIGTTQAEGLVLTPVVDLAARNGSRIITKIKTKDFR